MIFDTLRMITAVKECMYYNTLFNQIFFIYYPIIHNTCYTVCINIQDTYHTIIIHHEKNVGKLKMFTQNEFFIMENGGK